MNEPLATQYDPAAVEAPITRLWDEAGCFHADPDDRPPERRFCIVIPPPNVTGALHLGHAINGTLQDVLVRWRRMQGFNTLWVPGTDHAGIATQAVVERRILQEEGKTRHELGREELLRRIWAWKDEYEQRILSQFRRMGASCDWRRTRFTLDPQCARAVRHTFYRLFREGYIYRGRRLVNWDTQLQTAVADDEVYHETVRGHLYYLRYPLLDRGPDDPPWLVVATTRPETMLGDVAVAVHPSDERYRHLVGRRVLLPLMERPIPVIADEWAKPEMGSGCVKITPGHDYNDWEVGQRHGLEVINVFHPDGTINEHGGAYAGLTREEARRRVLEDLRARELIEKIEDYDIDLAHSDRSKTPIEPFLSLQWFIRMEHLAARAMEAVESGSIRIFPPRYARTYLDWLAEKRDWCISRQLWWGHRIPIWYVRDGDEDRLQRAFGGREDIVWAPNEEEGGWVVCSRDEDLPDSPAEGLTLEQDPDVLDTWFSSALWPHSTLGWPEMTPELRYWYPTSVLVTSRDIITLWVARMVVASLFNLNEIPFRHVYIHTKILDGQGRTMSKSLGNGVDPVDIIEAYGADALRYTLAWMATETQDVRMPVRPMTLPDGRTVNTSEKFELGRNFCNKLWNAARFCFMHLEGLDSEPLDVASLPVEDRWILSRLSGTAAAVNEALEGYHFSRAVTLARDLFWDSFCDWYVELAKGRIQRGDRDREARRVLAFALDQILRLLHPVTAFITERLWQQLNRVAPRRDLGGALVCPPAEVLAVAAYPPMEGWPGVHDPALEERFADLQAIVRGVRDVRMRFQVGQRQPVRIVVRADGQQARGLEENRALIGHLAGVEAMRIEPSAQRPPNAATIVAGGMTLFVLDVADDEAERARLVRQREQTLRAIEGKQRKLANEGFLRNAPPEVVALERQRLDELTEQLRQIESSLGELGWRG